MNGRYSFLLYTGRAHHFFRLKLKGVKKVVMYSIPENPHFYAEVGANLTSPGSEEGQKEMRVMFSKWEVLALERVVGSDRVKGMISSTGDTFEFV